MNVENKIVRVFLKKITNKYVCYTLKPVKKTPYMTKKAIVASLLMIKKHPPALLTNLAIRKGHREKKESGWPATKRG